MDWATAITSKQEALARIVASMIAMLGLANEDGVARMPSPLYRAILRVLRPAESAVRRLIVVAAQGLKIELTPPRPRPNTEPGRSGSGTRRPSFPLFDPPHRVSGRGRSSQRTAPKAEPRIHLFDGHSYVSSSPPQPTKPEDGRVGTQRLARRLAAIKQALENLPAQAKRLARMQARLAKTQPPAPKPPLRPGPPPGFRQKPQQEVDWLLWECHLLAIDRLAEPPIPDTS